MGIVAALLAILGYALCINRLVKWPLESSLLFVCASLICLLYFAGLLGFLQITAQASLGVGVLLFLEGVLFQRRNKSIAQSVSPGMVFFVLSTIGLWILAHTEYYSNFVFVDDFSHWGRVSKIIAENDRLIISSDAVWFPDYTPGMALFDYLFFQISKFSASQAMFAHGVFIFAAFAQLFSIFSRPVNKYAFFGISIFIYSLIYFFGLGLHTLSVDLIVGVVFGVALFGYLADRDNGWLASVIRLVPMVMVLPLLKLIGILFSFVIVGVVACDILLSSIGGRQKIKLFLATLLLFVACIFTYVSWGTHVKNMGIQKSFNAEIPLSEVVKAFNSESATERQKTTIEHFARSVFFPHAESKISRNYYWLALCLAFVWLIWHMGGDYKSWVKLVPFAVLFCGFCAYLTVLLVLYIFSFSAYDGLRLASFERYVNTYLIGVLIVLFGVSSSQYFKAKRDKATTISLIAIGLLVMLPILKEELPYVRQALKGELLGQQDRDFEKVTKYWKVIEGRVPLKSRIYFVWQGSDGTENTIFNYGMMVRGSNRGCWSVGEPYAESDVWTCRMTTSEFEQALKEYDYLLVAHADKKFADEFSSLFGSKRVQDGELFKIIKETGHLSFRKI